MSLPTRRLLCLWLCVLFAGPLGCRSVQGEAPPPRPAAVASALPLPAAESVRFACIADFGWDGPGEARVAALVRGWEPAFVVAAGDDNYPDGAAETLDANIGQHYHPFIRFDARYRGPWRDKGSREQRFFAALGNHDWHAAGAQPLLGYLELPGNRRYYSVERGPVALFILDSDCHEPDGTDMNSKQAQWLQAALKNSNAPWKVVVLHHPPYSSGPHGSTPGMQWPYRKWGASLVVAGHDHHYERVHVDGLPYLVIGTGGAELRDVRALPLAEAQLDVTYGKNFGALLVQADAQRLTLRFYNIEHEMLDMYELSM